MKTNTYKNREWKKYNKKHDKHFYTFVKILLEWLVKKTLCGFSKLKFNLNCSFILTRMLTYIWKTFLSC